MERSVTDPAVSHVLIITDQSYQEKADKRSGGVGVETQIISPHVYQRVDPGAVCTCVAGKAVRGPRGRVNPYSPSLVD